jgi:hypothetical protein
MSGNTLRPAGAVFFRHVLPELHKNQSNEVRFSVI